MEPELIGRARRGTSFRAVHGDSRVLGVRLALDMGHACALRERHIERRTLARVEATHRLLLVDGCDHLETVKGALAKEREYTRVTEMLGSNGREVRVIEGESITNVSHSDRLVGGQQRHLVEKVE